MKIYVSPDTRKCYLQSHYFFFFLVYGEENKCTKCNIDCLWYKIEYFWLHIKFPFRQISQILLKLGIVEIYSRKSDHRCIIFIPPACFFIVYSEWIWIFVLILSFNYHSKDINCNNCFYLFHLSSTRRQLQRNHPFFAWLSWRFFRYRWYLLNFAFLIILPFLVSIHRV